MALPDIRALTFDVFGTVVDWRSSIITALTQAAERKLATSPSSSSSLSASQVDRIRSVDWATFAQAWRTSYGRFTRGFVPGETEWKDIDTHHRDSLIQLLEEHELAGTYTADEIEELSKAWHFLTPWPDSAAGIRALGAKVVTSTLSNGNRSLLADLNEFGNLGFMEIISAEDFKAYKPSREVYLGAVRKLGLEPRQVAMVATHLGDLKAARECGLRTVYVERKGEEEWKAGEERYEGAKGWVDVWVREEEEGFVEVAKRMGIM